MTVLVTGAADGIGLATCVKFIEKGWTVIGLDVARLELRHDKEDELEEDHNLQVDELLNHDKFFFLKWDIRDGLPIKSLTGLGVLPIHVLVNNAGVQVNSPYAIDVNTTGLIRITEEFIKHFDSYIESIINVGSVSAHTGEEFPYYAASKGALLPYTKNVAARIAKYGATCNCISPGGVLTELNRPVIDNEELFNKIMAVTPMKEWCKASDIAEWIYFLAAVQNGMTGQDIIIDNGENINSKFIWEDK